MADTMPKHSDEQTRAPPHYPGCKFQPYQVRQLTYNLVPLVDVIGSREQHAPAYHLPHNAADRPDVHVLRVPHAKDYLPHTEEEITAI